MGGICGFSLLEEDIEQVFPVLLVWGRMLRNDGSRSKKKSSEDSSKVSKLQEGGQRMEHF